MGVKETLSNKIGWRTVNNVVDLKTIDGSLAHTLIPRKKIKKRTRAFNLELKKFASLKSYSQYVKAKTAILRNISDNEDIDDDVDTRGDKMKSNKNMSVLPLTRTSDASDVSIGPESTDDDYSAKLPKKKKKKSRRLYNDGSNSCGISIDKPKTPKENDTPRTNGVSHRSKKKTSMNEKSPANVKRNLTLLWNNLDDKNDAASASNIASPIAQSTQINYGDDDTNGWNDEEPAEEVNDERQSRQKPDSPPKPDSSHDDNIISNENDLLDTDKISNDDSKADDEQITKLEKTAEADEQQLEETEVPSLDETPGTKRPQPVITCTEIVKGKYTIFREECNAEADAAVEDSATQNCNIDRENISSEDEEVTEVNELSPQSRRLNQMKRINLITNSSDSEESEDEVEENKNKGNEDNIRKVVAEKNIVSPDSSFIDESEDSEDEKLKSKEITSRPSLSQVISDPSDSDESIGDPDKTKNAEITKKFETSKARARKNSISNKSSSRKVVACSVNKSMKSQIREQESDEISDVADNENNINEAKIKNKRRKKICKSGSDIETSPTRSDNAGMVDEENEGNTDYSDRFIHETSARPNELCEFVDEEGLIATQRPSTITAKHLNKSARENGDEGIWLMEIPKSIIKDADNLCGKKIAFENGKITIDETTYKTTCRDEKSLSCTLRVGKKKTRYKTVNVELIGCIVVRQESSDKSVASPSFRTVENVQSCDNVPFPKDIKSRNPLLGQNDVLENIRINKARKRKRKSHESTKNRKLRKKSMSKIRNIVNFSSNV